VSNPLIARFAGEPALIEPMQVERFRACLEAVVEHGRFEDMQAERADTTDDFWDTEAWYARYRPYDVADGVLQIPIKGVLLQGFPYALSDWATGYEYIWRAFQRGCADYMIGAIKGIALVIDSPGGMVAGCFDAVDRAYALKQTSGVPVRAFAHESAYSAAYAWFSLGDQGIVSRTGGVGSIGVVTSHLDLSAALENAGYKITFIHAGKHKVDGNSYQPLPEDVRARIQARIDELYEVFVSTVARNRPQLSEDAIRETEALTFTATQALSNGLADSIGPLDDALVAFAADLSSTEGDERMSTQDTAAETQAAIDAAVAEANARAAANQTTAVAEAVTAERARIAAILDSEEGKARPATARMLAFDTDKDPESARAALAKLPAEATESVDSGASFDADMRSGAPNVGASAGSPEPGSSDDSDAASVLALAAAVGVAGARAQARA
jgi:signal peptide peptidase SppA